MSRRLMLRSGAGVSPVLPAEYQRVEWIGRNTSSSSGPYIDTGISFDAGIKITAFVELLNGADAKFLGSYSGGAGVLNSNLRALFFTPINTSLTFSSGVNELVVLKTALNSSKYELNGVTTTVQGGNSGTLNILIMSAKFNQSTTYSSFCGNFHDYVSIENSDGLIGLFIPCYRKQDGVIGMYDTVSQTFHTNSGDGTFTKGADV